VEHGKLCAVFDFGQLAAGVPAFPVVDDKGNDLFSSFMKPQT
jgi:hypothetical protein